MIKKRFFILIITISVSVLTLFLSCYSALAKEKNKNYNPEYRLMAYENTIALYKNEELIEIYDEIVLNSLPIYDREAFKKGIIISDISTIDEILQDYE